MARQKADWTVQSVHAAAALEAHRPVGHPPLHHPPPQTAHLQPQYLCLAAHSPDCPWIGLPGCPATPAPLERDVASHATDTAWECNMLQQGPLVLFAITAITHLLLQGLMLCTCCFVLGSHSMLP